MFRVGGASPPDPDRLMKYCSVGERDQCSQTHLVADYGVRLEAQEVPDISRRNVHVLLVEDLAFHVARDWNLPTPGVSDLRVG